MAGKRLLDAARLFNAGTAIAKQHFVLRRQQWNLLTQTSSLAKAVRHQTDRVTVTVAAAIELTRRLNETGPSWQRGQQENYDAQAARDSAQTPHDTGSSPSQPGYRASASGTAGSNIDEAQSRHLRELQRQSERQIPSVTVGSASTEGPEFGQDTFNLRPEALDTEHSSLPRAKLPKHVDERSSLPTRDAKPSLDQDVFPSPETAHKETGVGEEHRDRSEERTDALASIGVSRMGGSGRLGLNGPYGARKKVPPQPLPEMISAADRWRTERDASMPAAQRPEVTQEGTGAPEAQADTADLAASIAQDTLSSSEPLAAAEPAPYEMRESRVPSSRFGRLWQYGGLATSMAFGAVGESFRRLGGATGQGSLMLSEGNMNRLVAKLSRMRGAALKLGQMISFSDSKVLPATISAVLQRVQDSADYMPASQRDKVLIRNLGPEWRDLFADFTEKPFAAASIGQVHKATLASNGKEVAVKIQYPGVRDSIDSDLNNLSLLLTASQLLPRGLFLDKTIANARLELGWECDYEREAQACIRFKDELLHDEPDTFAVPKIYTEASGPDVLTAEFMHGKGVTRIEDLSQQERDWIGSNILRLCLRELMEWRFMQTDPNWTNFLYNRQSKRIELLDFGASREFSREFVEPYVALLIAASKGDREACRDYSIQLGYLTGEESQGMLKAHVDSILTLAEPFTNGAPEVYDFENQTITDRVRSNIGLMLKERLAPPPEETYSLHRKLSGAFLLCSKLRSRVEAREMFARAVKVWEGRAESVK